MKDCWGSGHEAHWEVDVRGANTVNSRVYDPEEWCLDAGQNTENPNGQQVVLNKASVFPADVARVINNLDSARLAYTINYGNILTII
jgi:hypothetical protein